MQNAVLLPAKILLPAPEVDLSRWAVVACDQFTSQPAYWQQADTLVGLSPSTLKIILPEVYLEEANAPQRIVAVHKAMRDYRAEVLRRSIQGFVYVERTMQNQSVRQGLVGCVDLEDYSFAPDAACAIRPSEHTIVDRIPPRLEVRRDACLESPHILMLADDEAATVIEPLAERKETMELLYDVELMQGGGRIQGWAVIKPEELELISQALLALQNDDTYRLRYPEADAAPPFVLALGDGNHSLATAKAHWEEIKALLPQDQMEGHPARYCLVELENIHSPSIEIEPIHRVAFGTNGASLIKQLQGKALAEGACLEAACNTGKADFSIVVQGDKMGYTLKNSSSALTVGALDKYLESLIADGAPLKLDYIHGEAEVIALSKQGAVGLLLPVFKKSDLFRGMALGGVLPKKTFSMGHAEEKRYYMECRNIEPEEKR